MQKKKKLNAKQVLKALLDNIAVSLEELKDKETEFCLGEKYAYAECLELIQFYWEDAEKYGLNKNPEEIYNIK